MIRPPDIRRKASNLYDKFVRAWLDGDELFFPRAIPARLRPSGELTEVIDWVRALRDGSKEVLGYGYAIEWREINNRRYGRNRFPVRILFETRDDYLKFIGASGDFERFTAAADAIRSRHPDLADWVRSNVAQLTEHAADLPGLLEVVDTLLRNPRPDCFARQLLVSVDTKFVERHQGLLRQWLDLVLPPHTIRADEEHFERRYGLRYAEPHLMVRFLDVAIQEELGFPCDALSIPLHTIGSWQVNDIDVLIVENKVNLLTAPRLRRAIGIGALGKAVSLLRHLPWLQHARITYWGDLDVEGLAILSDLRGVLPQVRSFLMDAEVLAKWRHLGVPGTQRRLPVPPNLRPIECYAFHVCSEQNVRIEQERLPQAAVREAVEGTGLVPLAVGPECQQAE